MDKAHVIFSDPDLKDPEYLGHLINDHGKHDSSEQSIKEYENDIYSKANCLFYNLKGNLKIAVLALRDIQIGEELLTHYGTGYWQAYNKKSNKPLMKYTYFDEVVPSDDNKSINKCANSKCEIIKDLKYCSRCNVIKYCSKECQVFDWKKHKQICYKK